MSQTLTRLVPVDMEVRSEGDGRTVAGIVVPFDTPARVSDRGGPAYMEAFARGAFSKTIAEGGTARVKLLAHHNMLSNPLGVAQVLREDTAGLYGEFRISQTAAGDDALELLRDGALDSFSVGFRPMQHRLQRSVTVRTEVALREVSLVTIPAYEDARVSAVRSLADMSDDERMELARMVAEHIDLASITRDSEPVETDTPTGAVDADTEPTDSHSLRHLHAKARARAREKGVL